MAQSKNRKDKVALYDGDKQITYGQWGERTSQLAQAMKAHGIEKGDRVALLMLNDARYLELLYAVTMIGAVIVPLNIRLGKEELLYMLQDSETKMLFVHKEFAPFLPQLKQSVPCIQQYILCEDDMVLEGTAPYEEWIGDYEPQPLKAYAKPDDLAVILYTGGTTGLPKGVMLTHSNVMANANNASNSLSFVENEIYLHSAPMFHAADQASTYAVTIRGGSHAIIRRFDPEVMVAAIEKHRVTSTMVVPTMLNMIINAPNFSKYDLSSLRRFSYGASPCPPELLKKAVKLFPNVIFVQGYGLSEGAPLICVLRPEYHITDGNEYETNRLASCGQPLAGLEARVVNESGEDVAPGEVGEIIARGPNVMIGYWNKPEETEKALVDGWLHTGDMATVDENNFFYIVDRKKDMIVTGAENVYSIEVENVLYKHPSILETAVIGVPHEHWGEAVTAIVVLKENESVTEDEIIAFCRETLANYKVPKTVEFVDELPKSGAGKILKRKLREEHWETATRNVN